MANNEEQCCSQGTGLTELSSRLKTGRFPVAVGGMPTLALCGFTVVLPLAPLWLGMQKKRRDECSGPYLRMITTEGCT